LEAHNDFLKELRKQRQTEKEIYKPSDRNRIREIQVRQ
jgi:hypothetical protein